MEKIHSDITKTIGNTPLVRLSRMFKGLPDTVEVLRFSERKQERPDGP